MNLTVSYNRLLLSVQRKESPEKLSLNQSAVLKLLRQTRNKIENSGRSLGKKNGGRPEKQVSVHPDSAILG